MRMRTRTSHYSLDRYHYYPLGGAEEVQCKDRGAEVQTKYVQMFSRGDCAGDCAGGAENVQEVQRWCREGADAEVQRCRGVGAEQGCRCRAGAECRGAGVQSMCRGSEYLQGFRRGDCAGNCAEEVQIWRCSNRHAEVQVIVQAQWWFSRGAEVTRGGAKQVQR